MRGNNKIIWALVIIILNANSAWAEFQWVNNITLGEEDMSWSYIETFTDADSIAYRSGLDENIGNNDSFINAWELLLADKEVRKNLKNAIYADFDVRIDNSSEGIKVIDVDTVLSPETIGNTHISDTVVNRYNVTYRLNRSLENAASIWFMGEPGSPVTITVPKGIEVVNISGMDNVTQKITDHIEITGTFGGISEGRGEITLNLAQNQIQNESLPMPVINETNVSSNMNETEKKITKTIIERLYESLSGVKNTSIR